MSNGKRRRMIDRHMTCSPQTKAAWWLATFLSVFVTGEMPIQGELEPEFLQALENHTVTQGRDVHFTCVVNHLSNYRCSALIFKTNKSIAGANFAIGSYSDLKFQVAWIKSDSKAILAIHTNMVALNPRLSVTYNNHNTWKLHVSNVQANDSGTYMCQVNTDPMKSQMGHLSVVIPPDIVDSVTEGSSAREGGSIRLTCSATGVPPPTVMWRREHNKPIVFRAEGGKERKVVSNHKGESLELSHVLRTDMGAYYCIASNGIPPTVSRRYHVQVHFIPQVKVSNQLVGAPLGSELQLQCYIEAAPKAMNSWYREDGKSLVSDKLLDNAKLRVTETVVNEYALWMNLTIKSLAPSDFGTYVCASVNALGKMESQVSVHRLELNMNGFAEEPMVSGAAWQRARSPPALRPAASHAHYFLAHHLPPQLYALLLTTLRYVHNF
ncbi:lachesin-like [Pectinophora gossypiella]|uniref:lachesin-like n=1 Tax=Pectinophora gossypiella TaxID=13191 RepID=UPI00214F0DD4|nr:lachesin-like [Pectinophora gossypiella]